MAENLQTFEILNKNKNIKIKNLNENFRKISKLILMKKKQ